MGIVPIVGPQRRQRDRNVSPEPYGSDDDGSGTGEPQWSSPILAETYRGSHLNGGRDRERRGFYDVHGFNGARELSTNRRRPIDASGLGRARLSIDNDMDMLDQDGTELRATVDSYVGRIAAERWIGVRMAA